MHEELEPKGTEESLGEPLRRALEKPRHKEPEPRREALEKPRRA